MQNNPRNRDVIQELRGKRQEVPGIVDEAAAPVSAPEENKETLGTVTECIRLNVRKYPHSKAEVVTVIDAMTQVTVDPVRSTEKFYKVTTPDGTEGYCMKEYVSIPKEQ